jgi:hypothetical protein
MFFFVWFLIPETKGLSLEKMDDLFGVTELVKQQLVEGDPEGQRQAPATELGFDGKPLSAAGNTEKNEVVTQESVEAGKR